MNSVHVLRHADGGIIGIFTSRGAATRVASRYYGKTCTELSEWPLDPAFTAVLLGHRAYNVSASLDGRRITCIALRIPDINAPTTYSVSRADNCVSGTHIWARTPRIAKNLLHAYRLQFIAQSRRA